MMMMKKCPEPDCRVLADTKYLLQSQSFASLERQEEKQKVCDRVIKALQTIIIQIQDKCQLSSSDMKHPSCSFKTHACIISLM